MKILLDHCVPRRLRRELSGHEVKTTHEMGWATLRNGDLLDQAQGEFDVLLTVDRSMQYEQNLKGRPLAVIILTGINNRFETLRLLIPDVEALLPTVQPGEFYRVTK